MGSLTRQHVLVTGGSRGLGLGIVEALVGRGAEVTVVARTPAYLSEVRSRLGVAILRGDASNADFVVDALRTVRPTVLVLNAGATPVMAPLHEQTWESFSEIWNNDVKAAFHWIQAALRLPLAAGSRVLIGSSGAALQGSPLSGGYAGAKRMLWLMASYANGVADELGLEICFQALLPLQIVGATQLGRTAAEAYARRKGVSTEAFLAGFGKPLSPHDYGTHVVSVLTEDRYARTTALGIRGDTGVETLQA